MTIRYFYLLKQNLRKVELLNQAITSNSEQNLFTKKSSDLAIQTNDSKIPTIFSNEFLFLESEGNYLHLICEKSGLIVKYKLRNTIKEFRDLNKHIPSIFHCHRAYLINLDRVLHIEGNAAGYLLNLHPETKKIPVSRSKINEFNQILNSTKTLRK